MRKIDRLQEYSVCKNYQNSKLSIAFIHACISPSKASLAYSKGSSIAKALRAFCEHKVVSNTSVDITESGIKLPGWYHSMLPLYENMGNIFLYGGFCKLEK